MPVFDPTNCARSAGARCVQCKPTPCFPRIRNIRSKPNSEMIRTEALASADDLRAHARQRPRVGPCRVRQVARMLSREIGRAPDIGPLPSPRFTPQARRFGLSRECFAARGRRPVSAQDCAAGAGLERSSWDKKVNSRRCSGRPNIGARQPSERNSSTSCWDNCAFRICREAGCFRLARRSRSLFCM